ncbi:MAG: anthranilate synthase component I family protein [Cytophagales bacterium]|jgi:para-aminobenzoate synthetase component 1|nr:anthranilate synthase component I family protein [Cytophagales bacterium]
MKKRTHQRFAYAGAGIGSRREAVRKALQWAVLSDCFHFFTDNQTGEQYPYGGFPTMLAVGAARKVPLQTGRVFGDLQEFLHEHADWLIGHFGYDLKNETEDLHSRNPDPTGFPEAFFYVPEHLVFFYENEAEIASLGEPAATWQKIAETPVVESAEPVFVGEVKPLTNRETYLDTVERLREHILEGDFYEINYCVTFLAENARFDPLAAYLALNELSPMPFSVFGRTGPHWLLCASPERFMKKTGNRLVSMPIKGTVRRGDNAEEDERLKTQLQTSEKERAENMMIVDLVRNDLARSALTGTVQVEEMFGIYTFAALHQMISTVSAQMRPGVGAAEAIRNAFPMGSMTGAPKVRAMQRIEQYEDTKRGLYSGTVGFFTPDGDFDFNVVIRSLLYNADTQCLSFSVGSAITYDASAEQEYAECLLKAETMRKAIQNSEFRI